MNLDLSVLDASVSDNAVKAVGQSLRIRLEDIEPDPNQPRKEKLPNEIEEMGESIKDRGVKLPISVKTHPTKPGKWMINDGELRYLGSQFARIEDIPAVVDEDFDDFDQVMANETRFALRPKELALFVKRKLSDGIKKGEISRRMHKPNNYVTELLALVDAPDYIDAIYASERCRSPKTLYELRVLGEAFPDQVKAWCETAEEVTRANVARLGKQLKGSPKGKDPLPTTQTESSAGEFRHDEISSVKDKAQGSGSENSGSSSFRHDEISKPSESAQTAPKIEPALKLSQSLCVNAIELGRLLETGRFAGMETSMSDLAKAQKLLQKVRAAVEDKILNV